jgi:hypothetical protein
MAFSLQTSSIILINPYPGSAGNFLGLQSNMLKRLRIRLMSSSCDISIEILDDRFYQITVVAAD